MGYSPGIATINLIKGILSIILPGSSSKETWELFMQQAELLINQKIEASARNKALAELQGITNLLDLYQKQLANWLESRGNPDSVEAVRKTHSDLISAFELQMPSFKVSEFEVAMLIIYVQAANLHLLTLKEFELYGLEWGYPQDDINLYHE